MTLKEYFYYAMENKLVNKFQWMVSVCQVMQKVDNEFIRLEDNQMFLKVDGEELVLQGFKKGNPIFRVNDKFDVGPEHMGIIKGNITTTFGIFISNMVLLEYGLSGKMPYINGEVDISKIEDQLLSLVENDPLDISDKKDDVIYVSDIDNLSKADMVVQSWSSVFVISRTVKTVVPPKGLDAKKKEVMAKLKKKYGDKLFTEEIHSIEYINEVKAFYVDYLKDDPTYGIVLSPKIVNKSLPKRRIAFGYETNVFDPAGASKMVETALSDGMDLSEEGFPYYVHSSRAGSLFRGVETQQSGTIANNLVGALMSVKYVNTDCGSKDYRHVLIQRGDRYKNRTILVNGKDIIEPDLSKYNSKFVHLRDPMDCKLPIGSFCSVCSGGSSSYMPTSVVLQATKTGGDLVNGDMKKMHGSEASTILVEF